MYFLSCTFCEYRIGGAVCTGAAVVILSSRTFCEQDCWIHLCSCRIFLFSLAHSVDRTVRSICTAVTKVVDLSTLEHLTGLDVCKDGTAITLGLLRLYVEESERSN